MAPRHFMVDLVLVRPGLNSLAEKHWSKSVPLGLGYLASTCRSRGISVAVVDGKLEGHRSSQNTIEAITSHRPFMVGVSALTAEYPQAVEIASNIKKTLPEAVTVLGGAHASALPIESLQKGSGFDYVIAGEGEYALVELFSSSKNGEKQNALPGIYNRRDDGTICGYGRAELEASLENLPFPAWDLFPRVKTYPIMSERGCPYQCVFCSRNMTNRVNSRPADNVIEEITWLHREFAAKTIYFEDETFGLNRDRTEELLNKITALNKNMGISFKAQTRVDQINRRIAKLMKKAGFEYIELGVESGDPGVLRRAKKGTELEKIEVAVRVLKEEGLKVWADFIIGLPGENKKTIRKSINMAAKLNPNRLSVAIIVAYPGTEVYRWALTGENGYRLLTKDWGQFDKYLSSSLELDNLSYHTMRRMQFQMYLESYLRNFRFRDLFQLFWKNRQFFFAMAIRWITRHDNP